MQDLMIDIETLASSLDAVIMTIGAVTFDLRTGELGEKQHLVLDWTESQRDRRICPDTLRWWSRQENFLDTLSWKANVSLEGANQVLSQMIKPCDRVWANDPTFDLAILRDAGFALGSFRKERSCRTMFGLGREFGIETPKPEGVEHNALDDAIGQARSIAVIYQALAKR